MAVATGDQAVKVEEKRNMFLSLIRKNPGISRRECAIAMRVSTFYASKLVPELTDSGMVIEKGAPETTSGRGRPTKPLFINPGYEYFAGIDLEASTWRMAIVDFQGSCIHSYIRPFKSCKSRHDYLLQLDKLLTDAIKDAGALWNKVTAVGIGAPGFLDPETGIIKQYEILPAFKNIPFRDICKLTACKPVFIQNNVFNLATYDLLNRPQAGNLSVIHVALRSGISAALSLNGIVFRGSKNMAGEAGLSLFSNHEKLQDLAGLSGLRKKLPELSDEFWHGKSKAIDKVLADQENFKILQKAMNLAAIALANIASFMDPDELVIYSTLFSEDNQLWKMLENEFASCRGKQGLGPAILKNAGPSELSPAVGAAIFALENTYAS